MDTSKARADMELEVFMTSARANYDATGIFDGSGITVKKGSILSLEVTSDRIDVAQRDEAITPANSVATPRARSWACPSPRPA